MLYVYECNKLQANIFTSLCFDIESYDIDGMGDIENIDDFRLDFEQALKCCQFIRCISALSNSLLHEFQCKFDV